MSSTSKTGRLAGMAGLAVGCGVAVWLAGWVVAGPARNPPPAEPAQTAATPANPPGVPCGGLGSNQLGGQFGNNAGNPFTGTPAEAKAKMDELRKRYPFESITGRLDHKPAGAEVFRKSDPAPKVTAETLKRLDEVEKRMAGIKKWNHRAGSLRMLHEAEAQKFMERPGFGDEPHAGPPSPSPRFLELAVAPTIPFEAACETTTNGEKGTKALPADQDLATLGLRSLLDFANPIGLGYIKDREHVAGFQPHQFRQTPQLPVTDDAAKTEKWAVLRLELVSLLKHEQPVVYVTRALPRMEDVSGATDAAADPVRGEGIEGAEGRRRPGDGNVRRPYPHDRLVAGRQAVFGLP